MNHLHFLQVRFDYTNSLWFRRTRNVVFTHQRTGQNQAGEQRTPEKLTQLHSTQSLSRPATSKHSRTERDSEQWLPRGTAEKAGDSDRAGILARGSQLFFSKGQITNIYGFVDHQVSSQALDSAIVGKAASPGSKQMGMGVFQ